MRTEQANSGKPHTKCFLSGHLKTGYSSLILKYEAVCHRMSSHLNSLIGFYCSRAVTGVTARREIRCHAIKYSFVSKMLSHQPGYKWHKRTRPFSDGIPHPKLPEVSLFKCANTGGLQQRGTRATKANTDRNVQFTSVMWGCLSVSASPAAGGHSCLAHARSCDKDNMDPSDEWLTNKPLLDHLSHLARFPLCAPLSPPVVSLPTSFSQGWDGC